jgi:hypothetical protein
MSATATVVVMQTRESETSSDFMPPDIGIKLQLSILCESGGR